MGNRSCVVVGVLASACANNAKLIKATGEFATLAQASLGEVGGTPGIVNDLCEQRVEIEYTLRRLLPDPVRGFDEFFQHPLPIGDKGATTTWRKLCDGFKTADAAFAKALAAINAYGAALGSVTTKDYTPSTNLQALASGTADDAKGLGDNAARYHDAIAGLGAPLGKLADALATRWVARDLKRIVDATDAPFHEVIVRLREFVELVRTQQLADDRAAFQELIAALDALNQQKPELISAYTIATIDVDYTNRFAKLDAKLKSLADLLDQLGKAHAALKAGWDKGERAAIATLTELAGIARTTYSDVKQFRNPP